MLNPPEPEFFINVEVAQDAISPPIFGPFQVFSGSVIRFISDRLSLLATPGSANVNIEPISEMGWMGFGFTTGQIIAPGTPTQVFLGGPPPTVHLKSSI